MAKLQPFSCVAERASQNRRHFIAFIVRHKSLEQNFLAQKIFIATRALNCADVSNYHFLFSFPRRGLFIFSGFSFAFEILALLQFLSFFLDDLSSFAFVRAQKNLNNKKLEANPSECVQFKEGPHAGTHQRELLLSRQKFPTRSICSCRKKSADFVLRFHMPPRSFITFSLLALRKITFSVNEYSTMILRASSKS